MMAAMLLPLVEYLDEGHVKFVLVGQIHRNDQLLVSDNGFTDVSGDR